MRRLGKTQTAVLDALREHGRWSTNGLSGWVWDTRAGTRRVMDSLVKRGLARKVRGQDSITIYTPTSTPKEPTK